MYILILSQTIIKYLCTVKINVSMSLQEASSHSNLGAMLHVNGKYREAEACYREALRIKPDDSLTKGNLQLLQRKTLMDVTIVS